MQGLDCNDGTLAKSIQKAAFANHLVLETAGSRGQVIRCLPALTISDELLEEGLTVLEKTIYQTIDAHKV
jgi:diaminobutyrate-2-oxoglutarate transaminase